MTVDLEAVRSFWEANPCGSANSDERDRSAYFAGIERRRYSLEPHILEIAEFAAFADRDVLEIGCGTGNLALLAKRLHPDAEVVGLDPDPKALLRKRGLRASGRAGVSPAHLRRISGRPV